MNRTLYPLDLSIKQSRSKMKKDVEEFGPDLINVLKYFEKKEKTERKIDYETEKKVLYFEDFECDYEKDMLFIHIVSAKYNEQRNVVNTDDLSSRGVLKQEKDGDEEHVHLLMRFDEPTHGTCVFENNRNGASANKIFVYLNQLIERCHEENNSDVLYKIKYEHILSHEFIEQLERMGRICAVSLTVNQEELSVSDCKDFSGRNDISEDIDILLKPATKGASIGKDTVKEFFKLYNSTKRNIKRITVKAEGENQGDYMFNTEKIKAKSVVEVSPNILGVVEKESIHKSLYDLILEY